MREAVETYGPNDSLDEGGAFVAKMGAEAVYQALEKIDWIRVSTNCTRP